MKTPSLLEISSEFPVITTLAISLMLVTLVIDPPVISKSPPTDTFPEVLNVVTPLMAPALVIPSLLLLSPPSKVIPNLFTVRELNGVVPSEL